jgi:release factor glutamine methyltransferase
MKTVPVDEQHLRWLLRDKYHFSPSQVEEWLRMTPFQGVEEGSNPSLGSQSEISADINRLAQGEPLQYVIGWTPFLGLKIDLSQRTLIPRSETEYWVEQIMKEKKEESGLSVLDLCCGSGCIGLACLKYLKHLQLDCIDLDPRAIQQTQLNLKLNAFENEKVRVMQSDLFAELKTEQYDLILSNPPYVDPAGKVSPELAYEPALALFAQKNGLRLIEEIISVAKKHLREGGELVIEFGLGQEHEIAEVAKKANWKSLSFGTDQYGVIRYVRLK